MKSGSGSQLVTPPPSTRTPDYDPAAGYPWTASPAPIVNVGNLPNKKTDNPLTTTLSAREAWTKANSERLADRQNMMKLKGWGTILNAGKEIGAMVQNILNSSFTHAVNMKQLNNHAKFMYYQHDIAKRGMGLEDKKLDIAKDMQGAQLKYQLTVARYQKETAVTVAAIQQKGKTRRVQALAALRSFYSAGKPASPFQQRAMT